MTNCLKCPYCKRHDTKIYCPFFALADCPLMGEHYIPLVVPKKSAKQVAEKVKPEVAQPSYIPAYKPMHKTGTAGVIPWESLHECIFQSIHDSIGVRAIAVKLELKLSTLRSYLRRYGYYNEKEK